MFRVRSVARSGLPLLSLRAQKNALSGGSGGIFNRLMLSGAPKGFEKFFRNPNGKNEKGGNSGDEKGNQTNPDKKGNGNNNNQKKPETDYGNEIKIALFAVATFLFLASADDKPGR